MKIKTSKILAVLCILAMMVATIVPMLTIAATAADDGTWTLVTDASTLKAGDKIVIACNNTSKGSFVATTTITSNYMTNATTTFSSDKKTITTLPSNAAILTLGGSSGAWTLTNASNQKLGATNVKKVAWGSGTTTWKISISNGSATIQSTSSSYGRFLYNVNSPRFTTYTSNTSASMVLPQIYRLEQSGGSTSCEHEPKDAGVVTAPTCTVAGYTTYTCSKCGETYKGNETAALNHPNKTTTTVDPTCTVAGSTKVTCDDCGATISNTTIPAAHNYVDKVCTVCGKEQPNESTVSLTFDANKANRTEFSTSKQVWAQNGITFTNNKASSTNNIADYGAPVRLYANSSISITVDGNITKIVFDCNNATYATALGTSIGAAATVSSDKVTVVLDGTASQFTVAKLSAQVRLDSLEVTYEVSACAHENTTTETIDATCTKDGSETVTCDDCGAEISSTTIPAGHKYVGEVTKEATCNSDGVMTYTCQNEGCTEKTYTEPIRVNHSFNDENVCTTCGNFLNPKVTLYFDSAANRTSQDANSQVWWGAGFTLTNNKASSQTSIADYVNPARFYKDSTITISAIANFKQLVFYCDSSEYAKAIADSIEGAVQDKMTVTVNFDEAVAEYVITLAAATRIRSITVHYDITAIASASVALDTDLSITYQTVFASADSYENFYVEFTFNGKTVKAGPTEDGKYTLRGIAPHMMGDTITATLYNDDGDVVDVTTTSIKAYLESIIAGDYTSKVKDLAKDLLIYGAAAQKHQNYKTDALVTDKTPIVDDDKKPETDLVMSQVAEKVDGLTFAKVGVHFNYVNKLFITVNNTAGADITVKVNGVEAEIDANGTVYTGAISPDKFADDIYVFELYVDGELYQSVEYSVNSYINSKWSTDLAKALYNYAESFKAMQ